jgi:hypothetical protein
MDMRMTSTVAMIIHAVSPFSTVGVTVAAVAVGSAKVNPAKLNKAIRIKIFKKCFIFPPYKY